MPLNRPAVAVLVLGWNALLIFAVGGLRGSLIYKPIITVLTVALLMIPLSKTFYDRFKNVKADISLYSGLVGTMLLWTPMCLLVLANRSSFGGFAYYIETFSIYAGIFLLVIFAISLYYRTYD